MIYLSVDRFSVRLLSLSKALLGQYNVSYFSKTHTSPLLEDDGSAANVDVIASAIKEALTSASPKAVAEKDVVLVLPQSAFSFGRYSVPQDISDSAIFPFLKDKVRSELHVDVDNEHCDYILKRDQEQSIIFFYCQKQEVYDAFQEVMDLLQLHLYNVIPDTLALYTLFEKTLRKEKKEKILYAAYGKDDSFGYLYDSLGLLREEKYAFDDDFKPALKKVVVSLKKEGVELNRLILSGDQSKRVRQDLFTKDVGAWTNPLEKIITNFYQDDMRLITPAIEDSSFSLLRYDACFGAFLFDREYKDFSVMKKTGGNKKRQSSSSRRKLDLRIPHIMSLKTLIIFVISFVISFIVIFGLFRFNASKVKISIPKLASKTTPTPSPKPTVKPQPTPSVKREELKIIVLNGGGVVGKAKEISNFLLEEGYLEAIPKNVEGSDFSYEETLIKVKKGKEDAVTFIIEDLEGYVEIDKKNVSELDEEENADLIITIGKDFK